VLPTIDDIKLHLWSNIGLSDDREQARDDVSHWVASQAETFSKWRKLPDFLQPYKAEFEAASKAYDRLEHMSQHAGHKRVVSGELIDYLALVGSAEECLERIRNLSKLGLDGVTLAFRAGGRKERMDEIREGIIKPIKGK
jgi:5,10-methylenetetrahydromethanopterin reductase